MILTHKYTKLLKMLSDGLVNPNFLLMKLWQMNLLYEDMSVAKPLGEKTHLKFKNQRLLTLASTTDSQDAKETVAHLQCTLWAALIEN